MRHDLTGSLFKSDPCDVNSNEAEPPGEEQQPKPPQVSPASGPHAGQVSSPEGWGTNHHAGVLQDYRVGRSTLS